MRGRTWDDQIPCSNEIPDRGYGGWAFFGRRLIQGLRQGAIAG